MVLLTQLRNAAKRMPMIKFRAGNKNSHSEASTSAPGKEVTPAKPSGKSSGPTIEDWQLPPRYRRRTIDDKEIDAINSGGAY